MTNSLIKQANCNNCPSDPSTDQTRCQCDNSNYPNNWVDCTDGSGGKLQVSSSGESTTYTPLAASFSKDPMNVQDNIADKTEHIFRLNLFRAILFGILATKSLERG